jgi:hypothetical protein
MHASSAVGAFVVAAGSGPSCGSCGGTEGREALSGLVQAEALDFERLPLISLLVTKVAVEVPHHL